MCKIKVETLHKCQILSFADDFQLDIVLPFLNCVLLQIH